MIKFELLPEEFELLRRMFAELEEKHTNASCNDFEIESTPEMNLVVAIAESSWPEQAMSDRGIDVVDGKIHTEDSTIREYLEGRLGLREE